MSNAGAAPTGCFKCGRPGHWSRDCPSSAPDSTPSPNPNTDPTSDSTQQQSKSENYKNSNNAAVEKPKKVPRTRPKLTPENLLSDEGLGYVLRHFPRSFKYRGRGHEVSDLENLIGMYKEWHSKLLPSYSFEQFVHKVEQVGSTKRVKVALRDLREKVANGGDLTKLHEISVDQEGNLEQEDEELEDPSHNPVDATFQNQDDIMQEDMLHDIYELASEDASQSKTSDNATQSEVNVSSKEPAATVNSQEPVQGNSILKSSTGNEMTEEQKARIEANRLKALEKAATRKAATFSAPSQQM